MALAPILNAPIVIQFHVAAAVLALALGPLVLYRRPRDRFHRVAGYAWVVAMAITAATGLMIPASILPLFGGFGPIHVLSGVVFLTLAHAIRCIRRGDRTAHENAMRGLYWNGIGIAGLFTLMPGRVLNAVLFPALPEAGYGAIIAGVLGLMILNIRWYRLALPAG